MSVTRRCLILVAAAWLAACATTRAERPAAGGDRLLLGSAELRAETDARTLADVVRRRRPTWLAFRGATSLEGRAGEIVVYVDGVRAGGPSVLQTIPVESVESARFLGAAEATTRFGTGHVLGAILVATRR